MEPELRAASPDGRFTIEVIPWEARMSHWVETPQLYDRLTQRVLWRCQDSCWSLTRASWLDDRQVELWLRRYPGDHVPPELCCWIDCARGRARLADGAELELAELERALFARLRAVR